MILRSVTKHVRNQNWFAVGLDFLIVVVGVFIGIQVANWNAARQDLALERVLMERLQRDFSQLLDLDYERYARTTTAPEVLGRLIDAIRNNEEPDSEQVWPGIVAAMVTYVSTPSSPTYDELLSTGRLSQLTNESLRTQLGEFERSRFAEQQLVSSLVEQSFGSLLLSRVQLDTEISGIDISGNYEWEDLADTIPYLQERLIYVHALANWRRNSHEIAQQILVQLEEELQ